MPDPARLEGALDRLGVRERTVVTGRVPLADLATHIGVADVVAHLRYPTARETSAALLRVLAQGRATIVSDLAHQADLPEDVVVRVDVTDEEGGLARAILGLAGDSQARARPRRGSGRARAAGARPVPGPRSVGHRARVGRGGLPAPRPGNWPAHWPRT